MTANLWWFLHQHLPGAVVLLAVLGVLAPRGLVLVIREWRRHHAER